MNIIKKSIALIMSATMMTSVLPVMQVSAETNTSPSAPTQLLTNELENPLNTEDVTFGWIVNDADENEVQTAYEIVVTDGVTNEQVWDSGKVSSSEQSYVAYNGENLESGHPYLWKVKTWDKDDAESVYSEPAYFATGLDTVKPTSTPTGEVESSYKFNFGNTAPTDGRIVVPANTAYGTQSGGMTYGFIGISGSENTGTSGMLDGFYFDTDKPVTTLKNGDTYVETDYSAYDADFIEKLADGHLPIRFSAKMEEHRYYKVTATIKNTSSTESTHATLMSEKRHFMMFEEELAPNELVTKTFNVNLESVFANNKVNSDEIINVCVSGKNVGLVSVEIDKLKDFGRTVWVLGDSTVCDQRAAVPYYPLQNYSGLGQFLPMYINPEIAVSNQAEGGLKAYDSNHYDNAIAHMRAGDYLYVQYGINDKTYHNDTVKFKRDIEKYYTSAHEKGVKLIIASTIDHHDTTLNWDSTNNLWKSSMSNYCQAAKEFVDDKIASGAEDIAFIDINAPYIEWMNKAGGEITEQRKAAGYNDENVSPLAINYYYTSGWTIGIDRTHTNDAGADNAAYIAIQQAKNTVDSVGGNKKLVKIDAEYDANGVMKSVSTKEIIEFEYVEPVNTALKKTFYWESLDGMKPYVPIGAIADKNTQVQASVLSGFVKNMPERIPYKVTDDVVAAGWVPNSTFPNLGGGGDYEYPLLIESVLLENSKLTSMQIKVQGSMGHYAQGVAEIYNSNNEKTATLYTTEHIDNTAATYGNVYTLYFNTSDAENAFSEGYTYKVYMVAKGADEEIKYSDEYTDSYMRTVELKYADGSADKGTITGGGSYAVNSTVTISAEVTAQGYIFGGWYNQDNTLYSKEETVTISKLKDNLVLSAKFVYPASTIAEADFEDSDTALMAKIGKISGNAIINTTRGGSAFGNMAQLNGGSDLTMTLENSADGVVTAEFDAYYMSNENGKHSIIQLKDEDGNNLVDVKFSRYSASACYIKIGNQTIYSGNDAYNFIRDGKVGDEPVGGCTGVNVDYVGSKDAVKTPLESTTHITIGVDTNAGTAYIEFRSNTSTQRYSIVSGSISTGKKVKSLYMTSDFSESKSMWVDNIKVTQSSN